MEKELKPFCGLFNLSVRDRLHHSGIILILGSLIMAYNSWNVMQYITDPDMDDRIARSMSEISGWYIFPMFFLSTFLLISIWPVSDKKTMVGIITRILWRFIVSLIILFVYISISDLLTRFFYYNLPA